MKIIKKKDHHLGHAVGHMGEPGGFRSCVIRCPQCHSQLQTEQGDNTGHLVLVNETPQYQLVYITKCPNCNLKLGYLD